MEVEVKYSVPDRAAFDRLLALPALGGYALRPIESEQVVDSYLDTPSRALERGGYALRLRQSPAQTAWLATLKGLGGASGALHQREEVETDVPARLLPAAWPESPARELALRLAGAEPLDELFSLEQNRHRRQVWSGERLAAVLSLDVVTLSATANEAVSYELEIELLPHGTLADLELLSAAVADLGLPPQPRSKFARGLALLERGGLPPAPPVRPKTPGVRADEPMAEAGRKVLRFHFDRMLLHEAGARAGQEVRPLHAMRVAARRQRAALRLFGDSYKPKALKPLRSGLQTLAGCLGAVRDLDVLLSAAREYQASLPAPEAAALEPLLGAWMAERDTARAALAHHFDSDRYAAFKQHAAAFTHTPGVGVRPPGRGVRPLLVRQVLPARLWEHYAAVRAYETALPGAPLETVHALRLAAKRLRYALEFLAEALDPAAAEAIAAVVALQDHLGALQDLDVTIARLRAFDEALGRHPAQPDTRRAVRAYLAACRDRLRRLRRTLSSPWRRVDSPQFRKLLGRAASRL